MSIDTPEQDPAAQLEAMLAQLGPGLEKEAPEQFARMQLVLAALREGPQEGGGFAPEVQREVLELHRWQLGMQKQAYQKKLRALEPAEAKGDAVAKKAKVALERVIALLDAAVAQVGAPTPQAQQALEKAATAAHAALAENQAEYDRQFAQATMRPVPGGRIVSASGVELKPSQLKRATLAPTGARKK